MTTPVTTTTESTADILKKLAPTKEEILEYRRKQLAQADRSYLNDRLNVELPDGLYGEWIGRDDFSQYQAQAKGFVDGSQYLQKYNKLYETADGKSAVGDVVFMVIPKWMKEEQDKVAQEIADRRSGIRARDVDETEKALAESIGLSVDRDAKTTARVIDGNELKTIIKEGK